MNKIYIMTSEAFPGEVVFEFNELNLLTSYDLKGATLTEQMQVYILQNLPKEYNDLQELVKKSKAAKVEELKIDFEMFWNKYDDKINSSKKKALVRWCNMRPSERMNAYSFLPKYFASVPQGTRKKYVETYLNAELWNN